MGLKSWQPKYPFCSSTVGTKHSLSSQILHLQLACLWQRCCTRKSVNISELWIPNIADVEMPSGREHLSLTEVLLSIYFCRAAFHKERINFWLIYCFTGEELAEDLGACTSLWPMATKNTLSAFPSCFSLETKRRIHGLCFITYSCLDWGERKPQRLLFITLQTN